MDGPALATIAVDWACEAVTDEIVSLRMLASIWKADISSCLIAAEVVPPTDDFAAAPLGAITPVGVPNRKKSAALKTSATLNGSSR